MCVIIIIVIEYIRGCTTQYYTGTGDTRNRYPVCGIPNPYTMIIDETASKRKTSIYFPWMSGVVRDGGVGAGDSGDGQRPTDDGQRVDSQHDCEWSVCDKINIVRYESRASFLQPRRRAYDRRRTEDTASGYVGYRRHVQSVTLVRRDKHSGIRVAYQHNLVEKC